MPSFHASLLAQKTGVIFMSGGNLEDEGKSDRMSRFSLVANEFHADFAVVKPRSSHTLC